MDWDGKQIVDDFDHMMLLRPMGHLTAWNLREYCRLRLAFRCWLLPTSNFQPLTFRFYETIFSFGWRAPIRQYGLAALGGF